MEQTTAAKGPTPVHSVLHATYILELFATEEKEYLTLSEISRALSMHKTTVYRILRTLESVGWIEQSAQSGKYRLGTGILLVSSAVAMHHTARELIREEMTRLAETYNETVILSAVRGEGGICVDMVKSRHTLGLSRETGYPVPFWAGATGKMLLAAQPQDKYEYLLAQTAKEHPDLQGEISKIRERGFCMTVGEVDAGVAAVAVGISLSDGQTFCLSISGPQDRLLKLGYHTLRAALEESARRVEQKHRGSRG